MAIKGRAYSKTSWAFEERPVASSKLNTWDDRIEAALELVHFLLSHAWGGGDGVIRGATADDLKVVATPTPGMTVEVKPGYAFISRFPYKLALTTQTAAIAAPVSQPRIDLIQARLESWDVSVKTGAEAASPLPPIVDSDAIPLARVHCRVGMTSIKNADDSVNGYIVDKREFV